MAAQPQGGHEPNSSQQQQDRCLAGESWTQQRSHTPDLTGWTHHCDRRTHGLALWWYCMQSPFRFVCSVTGSRLWHFQKAQKLESALKSHLKNLHFLFSVFIFDVTKITSLWWLSQIQHTSLLHKIKQGQPLPEATSEPADIWLMSNPNHYPASLMNFYPKPCPPTNIAVYRNFYLCTFSAC